MKVLVANKIDLFSVDSIFDEKQFVSNDEGLALASKLDMEYYSVSAKNDSENATGEILKMAEQIKAKIDLLR